MASPGNINQPGGAPFDMHKLFKPSAPANPNPQNPSNPNLISAPFPPPSASYPPPTGGGVGGPYSFPPQTAPFHHPHPQFHPQLQVPRYSSPPPQDNTTQFANMHPHRSLSFPTPPLQPPPSSPHQFQNTQNNNLNNPNPGARLMALLSAPASTLEMPQQPAMSMHPIQPTSLGSESSDFSVPSNVPVIPPGSAIGMMNSGPIRMPSSKLPKGRHLIGDRVVYDVDVRLPGEVQPQLEVTPITKYGSDPGLVLGRQIAVNKTYICYGLKQGNIRVLNINTALRSLLKGLAQRVTDMAFFAADVHLLASASVDGRVYIWKITEDADEEDKPQISGRIVVAVQIVGEGESVHPRVCWHCHKQEILVVGIGKRVLRIDTTKVGKGVEFSAEVPLVCPVDKLVDGIHLVGFHDGEVTDLSMCQWMTTRLVSASADGMIKIWEDRKQQPIAVLRPHDGLPVNSVTFLAAPHRPDHIILITGGPLNREVKIWASASEEGWLLPSDAESWQCIQTLELKSSAEARPEEAFFNQVAALPSAGLLLLANAKKNAIYAVHLEYGPNPASSRMDYLAEFTVTMPILSFIGTSDLLPHGEQIVQVYCVQTQAIQQYALTLSQCLPPPMENAVLEKSDSTISREGSNIEGFPTLETSGGRPTEIQFSVGVPKPSVNESASMNTPAVRHPLTSPSGLSPEFPTSGLEAKQVSSAAVTSDVDVSTVTSPPLPLSPRLSRKLSGFKNPSNSLEPGPLASDNGDPKIFEYTVDRQVDAVHVNSTGSAAMDDNSRNVESISSLDDVSSGLSHPIKFNPPTHLVTPSEILMGSTSSEMIHVNERKNEEELNIQDVVINDTRNVEVDVKVVDEARFSQGDGISSQDELHTLVSEKEKSFCSQASDLGIEMARECRVPSPETFIVEESKQLDGTIVGEEPAKLSSTQKEECDSTNDDSRKTVDSATPTPVQQPAPTTKGKKNKGKNSQESGPSSPSPSAFISNDSSNEPGVSSSIQSVEAAFSEIMSMKEMLNQLMNMQKETYKQMSTLVAVPVTKEGRRIEAALGRNMEKSVRASADALWARFHEENAKQEKLARENTQQTTALVTNSLNKDLPAIVEKAVKKEFGTVVQAITRSISPLIEKTISTAVTEAFQKGVGDKAVSQLEKSVNSKLETTVARQIQAQFQTSGKQALQETLKSTLEASVIPAFDISCKAMFEQVDATFQKGMAEHAATIQQQFETMHSPLAHTLRDAINSASSITQTLSGELAERQRQLIALAANPKAPTPLVAQLDNGSFEDELSRLLAEHKYEEAFTAALHRNDVSIVSWLCSKVDLQGLLSTNPLPLSQGVLLSLLQQLSCDISRETARKLSWIRDVLSAINPADPMIMLHIRPIFEQVYQILNHQRSLPSTTGSDLSNIRLIMHVINSMLMTPK